MKKQGVPLLCLHLNASQYTLPGKIHWLFYDNNIPLLNSVKILYITVQSVENSKNFQTYITQSDLIAGLP